MKKIVVLACLAVVGCSQEPRQFGAPIPLVLANPDVGSTRAPAQPMIINTPRGSVICHETFPGSLNCY